jgi:polysaccharide pyruvyl transferase WcaK-like protein
LKRTIKKLLIERTGTNKKSAVGYAKVSIAVNREKDIMSSRKCRKISLFGNFGTLNIGNECTLQAMIHNMRRMLPNADINCICSNPEDVKLRHKIAAISMVQIYTNFGSVIESHRYKDIIRHLLKLMLIRIPLELIEWFRAIWALKGRDLLVMTGTGMLTDCSEGPMGLPYQIFKWAIAARICRLKVCFISVGVEPIRSKITRLLIKLSINTSDYVSFRDESSKEYITKLEIKNNFEIFPDLAFSLPETVFPGSKPKSPENPLIGIGLYDYQGRRADSNEYSNYIIKISNFICWLVNRNYPVQILIGDILYDNPVRADLYRSLQNLGINYGECKIFDEPIFSVQDLIDQIAATNYVVATRFHNVLMSIMMNKPLISISYERKNDSLMEAVGLGEYCQSINELNVARLTKQFIQLEKNSEKIKKILEVKTVGFRRETERQYFYLFKYILTNNEK